MLKFSKANTKLQKLAKVPALAAYLNGKRKVYSIDLLAGHTCPYAKDCLSKVVNGKVVDGPDTKFRCYAASLEALYTAKFASDEHNTKLIREAKTAANIFSLLQSSLPKNCGVLRIHSSGDFMNQEHFDAYIMLAEANPDKLFYAYTKNLKVWVARKNKIPANLVLTASFGGRLDDMIAKHNLRYVKVIYSQDDAGALEIDDNDSHAANPLTKDKSFTLLIHGVQKAGSEASKALSKLQKLKSA